MGTIGCDVSGAGSAVSQDKLVYTVTADGQVLAQSVSASVGAKADLQLGARNSAQGTIGSTGNSAGAFLSGDQNLEAQRRHIGGHLDRDYDDGLKIQVGSAIDSKQTLSQSGSWRSSSFVKIPLSICKLLAETLGLTDIALGAKTAFGSLMKGDLSGVGSGLWQLAKGVGKAALIVIPYGGLVMGAIGFVQNLAQGNILGAVVALGCGLLVFGGLKVLSNRLNAKTLEVAKEGFEKIVEKTAVTVSEKVSEKALEYAPQLAKEFGAQAGAKVVAGVEGELLKGTLETTRQAIGGYVEKKSAEAVQECTKSYIQAVLEKAGTTEVVKQTVLEQLRGISGSTTKELGEKLLELGMSPDRVEVVAAAMKKSVNTEMGEQFLSKLFKDKITDRLKDMMTSHYDFFSQQMRAGFNDSLEKGFEGMCERLSKKGFQDLSTVIFENGKLANVIADGAEKGFTIGFQNGFSKGLECIRKMVEKGVDDAFREYNKPTDSLGNSKSEDPEKKRAKELARRPEEEAKLFGTTVVAEEYGIMKALQDELKSCKPRYRRGPAMVAIHTKKVSKEVAGKSLYALSGAQAGSELAAPAIDRGVEQSEHLVVESVVPDGPGTSADDDSSFAA